MITNERIMEILDDGVLALDCAGELSDGELSATKEFLDVLDDRVDELRPDGRREAESSPLSRLMNLG